MPEVHPPIAPRRPTTLAAHGDERVDDWFWLRERDSPEVLDYLRAENDYTAARMGAFQSHQDALFEELKAHVRETDVGAPAPWGPWAYFARTTEGQQYARHCRIPRHTKPADEPGVGEAGAGEQIVLDENTVAEGHDYFRLGDLAISPDHSVAAYTVDFNGGERYELRFRDIESGRDVDETIPDVYYSLAWSADSRTVFYTRPDDTMRPFEVWRHTRGTSVSDDTRAYHEADERFDAWVHASRSGEYIFFGSDSRITSEVSLLPAASPEGTPRVVAPRVDGVEYGVDHRGDDLVIWSNVDGKTNFELYRAPVAAPQRDSWTTLVPHDLGVRLAHASAFRDFVLLYERTRGLERLRVLHDDGSIDEIALPDPVYSVWPGGTREFATNVLRYQYSSLVRPHSAFDYDVGARTNTLVKQQPVPGYDHEQYVAEREWATAPDGTAVPISIVHRRDTPVDGTAPLLVYGYGSYEASIDPTFDVDVLPLLDRGWVYAIAHPRGGGELGREWYENGKLAHKMHTFTDFIACADHLVAESYGDGARVIARGASAGGLLMGAITNLRPDRWRGVVAEVPFVDVLSTMSDPSIPLTVNEWEEWGNPAIADEYGSMRAYSPYDNLAAGVRYPKLLVTGGLNDPRVQYWEPAKYVAKLRAISPDTDVLLKMEMGAGHAGPSGRYDRMRDEAFVLTWMLDIA
ncbi:MAG TPA: S9 family peptidase [Acidimicrobiia bacterium]|jgi:oligopeptidase B